MYLCHLQQTEAAAEKHAKRAEAFVAPVETAAPTIEEKRKRKRSQEEKAEDEEGSKKAKKKTPKS